MRSKALVWNDALMSPDAHSNHHVATHATQSAHLYAIAPRWIPAYLALLMLCCALPFGAATLILDITRDLVAAAGIASGDGYPLRGPVFNAMMHLGPVWYYVLAVPLALGKSLGSTLLFVGLLSALKIPLAYACGKRMLDWRFGVAWAAMLAVPSWSLASAVIVTHTAAVEAALLLVALLALQLVQGGRRWLWLLLGVAVSLALHAHPSSLVLAPLLLMVIWQRRLSWRRDLPWIIGGVLSAGVLLLPAVIAEAREGWPALELLHTYAMARMHSEPMSILPFLRGVFLDGALLPSEYLSHAGLSIVLRAMLASVALLALIGTVRAMLDSRYQKVLWASLAVVAIAACGLFLLRPVTPFYMALITVPATSAVMALGLVALRSQRLLKMSLTLAAGLSVASCYLLLQAAASGLASLPVESIGNVRSSDRRAIPVALLPAWQLDRLARDLCSHDRTVIVHSEIASLLDASLFLSARLQCQGTSRIGIGGGAANLAADHRLGLTPGLARRLGLPGGERWQDAWTQRPKRVIAAAGTTALPAGDIYPLRERSRIDPTRHLWRFATESDDTVLVSQLFYAYDGARTLAVRANGKLQRPLIQTNAMNAYRCADCKGAVAWQVEASTPHPERADIVIAGR